MNITFSNRSEMKMKKRILVHIINPFFHINYRSVQKLPINAINKAYIRCW